MLIESPWRFNNKNINFSIELENVLNVTSLYNNILIGRKPDILFNSNRIVLSFSKMKSTIAENREIFHNELIIKVPVHFLGEKYYFPVIAFVDNELSLIRGAYLGFDKVFANIELSDDHFELKSKYGTIRIKYKIVLKNENIDSLPFLLNRDYKFSRHAKTSEYATTVVSNYQLIESRRCSLAVESFDLFNNLFPSNEIKCFLNSNYTHEKYIVERLKCICKKY